MARARFKAFASLDRKASPDAPESGDAVQRATGLAVQRFGKPYTATTTQGADVNRLVRDAYERVTWVYRSVNVIAHHSARLPVIVRSGDPKKGQPIPNHFLLPLLNWRANTFETAYEFRFGLSQQKQLSPRGAFVETVRNNGGDVIGMHLLPPQYTWPVPDAKTYVSGFNVVIGGAKWSLPARNVLWFKNRHPLDPYRSMTAIEAAGLAIDTSYLVRQYNATFLRNDGRPAGIVAINGDILPKDADELKDYFSGGQRAGEIRVIEADDVSFTDLAKSPHDMQFKETADAAKDEILASSGVPETMAGNASGRTFDNAQAEQEVFWTGTMPPELELTGGTFDLLDGDPFTFVDFDLSDVGIVQLIEQRRRTSLLAERQAGAISPNMYLAETGRAVIDDPQADQIYVPIGMVPVGMSRRPGTDVSTDTHQATVPVATGRASKAAPEPPPFVDPADGRKAAKAAAASTLDQWEATTASEMRLFFAKQERVVLEKLGGKQARLGTRHDNVRAGTKDINTGDVYNADRWNAELRDLGNRLFGELYKQVGEALLVDLIAGDTVSFDLHDPGVTAALARRVTNLVGVNKTTEDSIRDAITEGESAGSSISDIAASIKGVFDSASNYRATMIARTEVVGATNESQIQAAKQSGVVDTKTWLATEDQRTRDAHSELDGTEVALDEVFTSELGDIAYPGDPDADPGNTINCRCTMLYSTGQTVEADEG